MKQHDLNRRVRVWDLPLRVFHWALALCVMAALATGWIGEDWAMVWHLRLGLTVLALLAFRVIWGLIGGRWSRFTSFLFSPAALWRYWRGQARPEDRFEVGHSPLAALSVWVMLLLLIAQVGTGLFADDEIAFSGPLLRFVSERISKLCTHWHTNFGQWLVAGLIALHVLAIAFYQWRGRKLLAAMWHGDKALPPDTPASKDGWGLRSLAVLLLAACAAGAVLIARLA
ncbi:MAG TPA: cytochrome b/b6 domain-containing protein [Burkholderiaceae bacterium]|jgi:cytochrome b